MTSWESDIEKHIADRSILDDKARVPLGLPAAQKQTRVAMHVQCRISLPDHDWVVAAKHKLIPSVYASCVAGADGKMGVNGPTYCAVRSGKHDHSGADSHLYDFHHLFDLKEFSTFFIACYLLVPITVA
uniref:Uncharacterized protein n=1 Tax=Panagrolaimus sp. ES5 TaxID=591445 RepID=A0AC34FBS7_9BILA